jgi:quinol monooxygenase YgiN
MVHILARISVKPDAADSARDILSSLAAQSRLEAGCLSYDLYQRADAPHLFQTVEQWVDQASADGHMTTAHVGAAIAAAGPLFAAAPEIVAYRKLS